MFFPVNLIFNFLLGQGLKEKAAGPVAWVIAAVIAALAIWGAVAAYNSSVIDRYLLGERAEKAEKTIEQIEEAEGIDGELERRDDAFIEELEEGARNAATNDPEGAGSAVGPVTSNVHDSLRRGRNSRSAGEASPNPAPAD